MQQPALPAERSCQSTCLMGRKAERGAAVMVHQLFSPSFLDRCGMRSPLRMQPPGMHVQAFSHCFCCCYV